jgi:hypothetical protein
MQIFKNLVLTGAIGTVAAAGGLGFAEAAPLAGISLAAASVEALEQPLVGELAPDRIHYKRYRHQHPENGGSFYRHFYGDWPRYYFPSYQYRLDDYTYYYPPFYW